MSTAAAYSTEGALIVALRESRRITQFDVHFLTFYQEVMADSKYLIWRDELLRARESKRRCKGVRRPALGFLPILMKILCQGD
jgi:hypothetical protein